MVQACEDSEAAIKRAGKGYEEGLNNVISLKGDLLDNIQGENPTDWRAKNIPNLYHNWQMSDKTS